MKKLITIAFVVLGLASTVQADPITIVITSGTLVGEGTESSRVIGSGSSPSGFSFIAGGNAMEIPWGPAICWYPACSPGYTIDLYSRFERNGVSGFVTYDGVTYEIGRRAAPPLAYLDVTWAGSMTIPIGFTGGTLTAPFTFSGVFVYFDGSGSGGGQVNLIGSGLASAEMFPKGLGLHNERIFGISDIVYTFAEDDLAPTPEPGTWLLIGTGAALVARVRRRGDRSPAK
jgi:hypothetical protein